METIRDVPVILRREIEALMIQPFLEAFEQELGHEKTYAIAGRVVEDIARRQGAEYAKALGENSLATIEKQMRSWSANGALEFDVGYPDGEHSYLTVNRCAYVEMYERLGMRELGRLLSCRRDRAFYEGMNSQIKMERTETLMQGDGHCNFTFELKKAE